MILTGQRTLCRLEEVGSLGTHQQPQRGVTPSAKTPHVAGACERDALGGSVHTDFTGYPQQTWDAGWAHDSHLIGEVFPDKILTLQLKK